MSHFKDPGELTPDELSAMEFMKSVSDDLKEITKKQFGEFASFTLLVHTGEMNDENCERTLFSSGREPEEVRSIMIDYIQMLDVISDEMDGEPASGDFVPKEQQGGPHGH